VRHVSRLGQHCLTAAQRFLSRFALADVADQGDVSVEDQGSVRGERFRKLPLGARDSFNRIEKLRKVECIAIVIDN
jgi:hypothetical protein